MSVVHVDLPLWLAIPFALLLLLGSLIILIGALGLLRLPSFYQRIHGPAITITLGTGCFLLASMLYFSGLETRPVLHELLISAFLLLTAPVTSMMIMRASVYRDLRGGRIIRRSDGSESYRFPTNDDE
ncbi:cation:proton antiporter [Pseudomonas sp. gcc21]|uniref:monovalent cation/H(+) antiporter subunit G n=1 Tax=Pseudomonas sp. gcc21 TaxID=2726989 RepID=UPI0014517C0E|nr:monovalent cation/H(+) antiporter subunit G [Pseudomonas sp. gcc21]QJD59257.1 cation:proton antiporter [Pseudomonas sp. gcc21]